MPRPRITHLEATMAQVRLLQADILDQIADIERLQIAKKVGYRDTRVLLMAAIRVAPEGRPGWWPKPNWSPKR